MRAASWTIQAQHSTVPPGTSPGKFRGARSRLSCWWARAGGASGGSSLDLRLRWRGFSLEWGCVGAASRGPALRKGLDRTAGCDGGSGSRAVARVGRKILRLRGPSVDLPPCQRSTGGRSTADGIRRGNASPFSWTVPREGRSAAHPTPKGTHDSSFVRRRTNTSAFTTGSRSKRRSLGLQPTNADPCVPRGPQPETPDQRRRQPPGRGPCGDHPQRKPRQRTTTTRPPQAAQQHDETPAGSAPARSRPRRQRTSTTDPRRTAAPTSARSGLRRARCVRGWCRRSGGSGRPRRRGRTCRPRRPCPRRGGRRPSCCRPRRRP